MPALLPGIPQDLTLFLAGRFVRLTVCPLHSAHTDDWDDQQKLVFIIAIGECGYSFDSASGHPDDFEVDIYEMDSLIELAESFVDEGLYGPIPEALAFYIDYKAIARDLSVDFTETIIAGKRLIYACR